jgi:TonB-dependent receptor
MQEDIAAGYAMMELHLGRRIMILPGVRYEKTHTEYDAKKGESDNVRSEIGFFSDTSSTQNFGNWLPMAHLRYHVTNWMDLRLAYTHSLSRPDYTDYSPRERIRSGSSNNVDRGNPELRPASAINYDAILSVYPNRVGLLSFGVFYKEIEDLIYERDKTILDPALENLPSYTRGSRLSEPINNPFKATVKGYEIEWQTHFTYLPGLLSGLVLNVNYARVFSDTRYPQTLLKRDSKPPFRQTQIDTFRVGRMVDQPAHIANLSIGYDRRGFSGRISMLYQQSSLRSVADYPEGDSFTDTYLRWDAMVQQKLGRGMSVYLNLNNLTDRPEAASIGLGLPTSQEYYGWTADLGVRYRY